MGTTEKPTKVKKGIEKIKDLSGLISAIVVIGGALIGAGNWIVHEVNASTNERIDAIEQKMDDYQRQTELSTTRLELMTLIGSDPNNIIEIEKLARKYFGPPLNGDTYMTGIVSRWCEQHSRDCASVILK